eukprot:Plantae.Rhodophyta-Purpureofilum_apyrenoidigerum.ctg31531.p1 GENE.Plantae.Rhodophyta-Purpureofilum_apyrenoidigerum.ctg31531~~Plantae.Rhodophyta-Purpureofilum_apyrenoidigerum.ctg31531.p1  ORF type:complete len:235 (-),score=36.64 Plantae.Rhodophyta-Purpureofilum_apyrenoidigerum.ctg31531:971-1675(-)
MSSPVWEIDVLGRRSMCCPGLSEGLYTAMIADEQRQKEALAMNHLIERFQRFENNVRQQSGHPRAPIPNESCTMALAEEKHNPHSKSCAEELVTIDPPSPICQDDLKETEHSDERSKSFPEMWDGQVDEKKKFVCSACNKSFSVKPNLKRHYNTVHLKEKPFNCDMCGRSFGHKNVLDNHVRCVHKGIRPFRCSLCGKSFGFKVVLQGHIRAIHKTDMETLDKMCGEASEQSHE